MKEYHRNCVSLFREQSCEVQRYVLDPCCELREAIDTGLGNSPVVVVQPFLSHGRQPVGCDTISTVLLLILKCRWSYLSELHQGLQLGYLLIGDGYLKRSWDNGCG